MSDYQRPIRVGMVGGGRDAFIGAVHRMAASLDGSMCLVAGALSSTPERSLASARDLGLDEERSYSSWEEMITKEASRPANDRIEAVVIVTPNHVHFAVAKAALEAGFHVICDKPLVMNEAEADELVAIQARTGLVFAVTYNYTGYPMIKQARHLVRNGAIGTVRKIIVEYNQGWLATPLEKTGQKQADWRTDPSRAGMGGAMGDIGSHAENLVAYVTGLGITEFSSDVTTHVEGRALDDDASVLLRFENGARGILTASQICTGCQNDLRLRVWGTAGGLAWHQESPNRLVQNSIDGPEQIHHRADGSLCDASLAGTRLPGGHPEAFIEAFANIYRSAASAIRAGRDDGEAFDYPTVRDGARGVKFISAVVSNSGTGWSLFQEGV
ncbi:MAG: oxidoreductase [Phycisphaerae bacterium]|nr:oxidoreductase [Phycisphaerae bacterium]